MAARKNLPDKLFPKMKEWIETNGETLRAACKHFDVSSGSARKGFKKLGIQPEYTVKSKGGGQYRNKTVENKERRLCIEVCKKYQSIRLL